MAPCASSPILVCGAHTGVLVCSAALVKKRWVPPAVESSMEDTCYQLVLWLQFDLARGCVPLILAFLRRFDVRHTCQTVDIETRVAADVQ